MTIKCHDRGWRRDWGKPALLQKVTLRTISGCCSPAMFWRPFRLQIFFNFFYYFFDRLTFRVHLYPQIFQAYLLTVMYIPHQGLWNKGKAWGKGKGNWKIILLIVKSVNFIVAAGLVSASAHPVLLSQQWYYWFKLVFGIGINYFLFKTRKREFVGCHFKCFFHTLWIFCIL